MAKKAVTLKQDDDFDIDELENELENELNGDLEDEDDFDLEDDIEESMEDEEELDSEDEKKEVSSEERGDDVDWLMVPIKDIKLPTTSKRVRENDITDPDVIRLADSIKTVGLMSPITLTSDYTLVAGNRRLLAHKILEIDKIRAYIIDATSSDIFKLSLVENIQRKDLNKYEEALCYKKLLDNKVYKNQSQLAKALSISKAKVSVALSSLEEKEKPSEKKESVKKKATSMAISNTTLPSDVSAKVMKDRVIFSFEVLFHSDSHVKKIDIKKELESFLADLDTNDIRKEILILRKEL